MEPFGERLRRRRNAQGLKQRELGQAARMDSAQVSRYERGVIREPSAEVLARLARALNVSVTELRGEQAERRQPALQPLRAAVSRVQTLGDKALLDFVRSAVAHVNRIERRFSKDGRS
jgi:transcriptional regulator with XRE-family HTH domain